jgi:two-component system chemotaxis response regulator CheB
MIAIGGSLGGMKAVREILCRLPRDFSLPIAVVLHRHRDGDEMLRTFLEQDCLLPVGEVVDKDAIEGGRVYLCPPDYHLLMDDGCFALSTDDALNFARPSIDVFFESVAEWAGKRAVAVVLSGGGFDGAKGAKRIQAAGGLVIVQDPTTAEAQWMPAATIAATQSKHVMNLEQIAASLIELAAHPGNGI